MPINEEPSYSQPCGKQGDERTYTKKDRSSKEHPFFNQGYKGVGQQSKTKGNGAVQTGSRTCATCYAKGKRQWKCDNASGEATKEIAF